MQKKGINDNQMTVNAGLSVGLIGKAKGSNKGMNAANIEKILLACPDLNSDWLLTGRGDMLNPSSSPAVSSWPTRPRVPLSASAGSLSGDAVSVTLRDCEQLPLISQLPSYDYTIVIKGDSMKPKYESGDEIACRRINHSSFIQWGKVHVLDTSQGIIVKKIYEEGDCIRCVSINPDYPPFLVPKDEVFSLSLVVGLLSITEM